MFAIETFEKYAATAREARELAAFARATRAINEAEDPLAPGDREAGKVVAALEALFLMIAESEAEGDAEAGFAEVLQVMTGGELDEEQAEDLLDGFADALEDEGTEIRLKSTAESLRGDRAFAEHVLKLCAAALAAAGLEPDDADALLADFADQLDVPDERLEGLLAEVSSTLA